METYSDLCDIQIIVKFIVTGITETEFESGKIDFSNSDYSLYHANIERRNAVNFTESEIAIYGQFCLVGSTVDMVQEAFDERGNAVISMDGRELKTVSKLLYQVIQEENY